MYRRAIPRTADCPPRSSRGIRRRASKPSRSVAPGRESRSRRGLSSSAVRVHQARARSTHSGAWDPNRRAGGAPSLTGRGTRRFRRRPRSTTLKAQAPGQAARRCRDLVQARAKSRDYRAGVVRCSISFAHPAIDSCLRSGIGNGFGTVAAVFGAGVKQRPRRQILPRVIKAHKAKKTGLGFRHSISRQNASRPTQPGSE